MFRVTSSTFSTRRRWRRSAAPYLYTQKAKTLREESINPTDNSLSTKQPLPVGLNTSTQRSKNKQATSYRSTKQHLSLRIDTDVVDWFKSQGKGYQTRINQLLRQAMVEESR